MNKFGEESTIYKQCLRGEKCMNAVPFMENPKASDILTYREKIPCFDRAERIIAEEIAKGNRILHIGDKGCMPSETIVVIDFESASKVDYEGMKVSKWGGCEYKYFVLSDNKGAIEFDFGRLKE